ncbi:MAG: hypothetical protein Q4C30_03595 [Bacteroidia bacterium]|nr:hypothetical protein [Bacteroidia bacterium]
MNHAFCEAQETFHTSPLQIQTAEIRSTSPIDETIDAFNPSVIAEITTFALQFSCTYPYALKELRQVDAKIATSTPICHIQAEVFKSGDDISSFTAIGGGLSRRFHKFAIGMEYRLLVHKQAEGTTYKSSFSRVGMHVNPSKKFTIAMALQNVEARRMRYYTTEVDIPSFVVFGMKWDSRFVVLQTEVEKYWDRDPTIKLAATIKTPKAVFGSVGIKVRKSLAQPSAGVGVQTKHIMIDAAISYHTQLGISSGAMLSLNNLW